MRSNYDRIAVPPPARAELVGSEADAQRQRPVRTEPFGCLPRQAPRTGQGRDAGAIAALLAATLTGCVTVEAPDKPIVIELNVNIRQEVIYRLAADAQNTIENNQDIF